jgi:hypothetical protein
MPQGSHADVRPDRDELLSFAGELADIAAPIATRWFRHPLDIDLKSDKSPVTAADRAVEQAVRAAIAARYPAHGILGEEQGRERLDAEVVWVVDPIDGTAASSPLSSVGNPDRGGGAGSPSRGDRHACLGEVGSARGGGTPSRRGLPCRLPRSGDGAAVHHLALLFYADERAAFEGAAVAHTPASTAIATTMACSPPAHRSVVECRLEPFDYCSLCRVWRGAGGDHRLGGAVARFESDGGDRGGDPELHAAAMRAMGCRRGSAPDPAKGAAPSIP